MLNIFLFFITITVSLCSSELTTIKTEFQKVSQEIISVVQNKKLMKNDRNNIIIKTIVPMFDFELMAKLSLGKQWKKITKTKQNKFIELYVKRMKKSYSSKIDKYTNEKIVINSIKKVKRNRVVLNTSLLNDGDSLEVIYKFYKPNIQKKEKQAWLVYDVVISGVSIVRTDKAQFKAVLKDNSIDELMDRLNK
ncbi:Putative periplasmic protein [hydrothermal vent metagenome]|uniref:Periplasmic protein n=1 Tax=hydrothermal vent metagenome TaxID=652676 RepID=A0A3B1E7B0_9ZZZZ